MAIVGAVEIDLVARVARLQTDLDKATGLIKGFKDKSVQHFDGMSRAAENVGRTITAMVSVAGLSMLANFTKSVADETDQLINQAKYLGISTDKLSAFQHMALLAGVSAEGMTEALGKFSKNLGNAAEGTGPVADKIRSLGLSIEVLREMQPDEAFLQIGEAISKLSNSYERSAATTAIFGKSSIGLVNVFEKMPENISAAIAEVDKFHLSLSKEDEKKVQALDDAFDRLSQSIKGSARSLMVEFSGGIQAVVDFSSTAIANMAKDWTWGGPLLTAIMYAKKKMFDKEPDLSSGTIDRSGSGPVDAPKSAMATPGFTADQWQRILDESAKNHQALFGISDKYWQELQEKSGENYLLELDSVAMAQDAQVQVYRNHFANLDAEHAVHLEKWRADEEALNADMGAVWEAQLQNEERINSIRRQAQYATFGALADLLGQFAGKSKAAAQAQLLITKGISIFQIMAATHVAAAQALATTPPFPNFALASAVEGWGAAQVGLVAAGGIAQSVAIAKGGGSSFGGGSSGSGVGSPTTTPSGSSSSQPQQQQKTPIVFNISFNGAVLGTDVQEIVVNAMSDFVGKDGVFMLENSAQARTIAGATA